MTVVEARLGEEVEEAAVERREEEAHLEEAQEADRELSSCVQCSKSDLKTHQLII